MRGTRLLDEGGGIGVPRLTAEVLLAHVIGCRREWLYSHLTDPLTEQWSTEFDRLLNERLSRKPTQYITGTQEFYGREFHVSPEVLIPRPETEHLVEAALERLRTGGCQQRVIDIGTGSGAIAVTLALEAASKARVFACDIAAGALAVAQANARRLGAGTVGFFRCDLLGAVQRRTMTMIVSNPPYIPTHEAPSLAPEVRDHEPHLALFGGGDDGFGHYRTLIAQAGEVLDADGWLLLELAFNGSDTVMGLLDGPQWTEQAVRNDYAGHPRVAIARRRRAH